MWSYSLTPEHPVSLFPNWKGTCVQEAGGWRRAKKDVWREGQYSLCANPTLEYKTFSSSRNILTKAQVRCREAPNKNWVSASEHLIEAWCCAGGCDQRTNLTAVVTLQSWELEVQKVERLLVLSQRRSLLKPIWFGDHWAPTSQEKCWWVWWLWELPVGLSRCTEN